jgi:hypothetical protein
VDIVGERKLLSQKAKELGTNRDNEDEVVHETEANHRNCSAEEKQPQHLIRRRFHMGF